MKTASPSDMSLARPSDRVKLRTTKSGSSASSTKADCLDFHDAADFEHMRLGAMMFPQIGSHN